MKRFTQNELFELRNHVPINALIEDRLKMPSKISEGYFRFLCPLCGEFQTATNPKTNLARCFRCNKNFNTIDMVMTCQKSSFVETVNTLKAYRQRLKQMTGFNGNALASQEAHE
ncbi:MAG: CHC2 zinc finger domain-containing protein [Thermodesulfobacteriota bacterium]|nr:CHC2 zinc finger domain-containing protein [Thermodesulfobacteriota bacterium]